VVSIVQAGYRSVLTVALGSIRPTAAGAEGVFRPMGVLALRSSAWARRTSLRLPLPTSHCRGQPEIKMMM
jgi:hypothetical protein